VKNFSRERKSNPKRTIGLRLCVTPVLTMSLETHIAGAEDKLLDSLHFAGKPSASYVTERRSVTFVPQNSANITPAGVRLVRFNLADQNGWLMGDSLRLIMTIHNAKATSLIPVVDLPVSMFRRIRLIGNGFAMIEDIEEYGRVHQMFSLLQSSGRRYEAHAEGLGSEDLQPSCLTPPSWCRRTFGCEDSAHLHGDLQQHQRQHL
jgi:hypothetical protein